MSHEVHLVDVFAEHKYSGNQLAVVLDAADLATETMQAIARETNFSETTFVCAPRDHAGAWPVRIFTPGYELPFAGHPTLGTASVIRKQLPAASAATVTLALGVGAVPVRYDEESDRYWLTAPPIRFDQRYAPAAAAAALGIDVADIDTAAPVQWVDAGAAFAFVPIKHAAALRRCAADPGAFAAGFPGRRLHLYAFSRADEDGVDIEVRLFFDAAGVREDPATGSAAACLGGYLLEHAWLGAGDVDCVLAQGAQVGRPSRLYLQAGAADGTRIVKVGGRVIDVARGELL